MQDFSISYAVARNVNISGGYSQMLATETMQVVKKHENPTGNAYKNTNNWGRVMVTFKPTFFSKE
jgi:hypothetical protein